jgi:hypothetical protein
MVNISVSEEAAFRKDFSPSTPLCIIHITRREAARTTWAAFVLLDRIGNNDGNKVVPHVIRVSGALLSPSILGTIKHTQIAATEWNTVGRRLRRSKPTLACRVRVSLNMPPLIQYGSSWCNTTTHQRVEPSYVGVPGIWMDLQLMSGHRNTDKNVAALGCGR